MINKTNSILNGDEHKRKYWAEMDKTNDTHNARCMTELGVDIDIENELMQKCWYVQGHSNQSTDKYNQGPRGEVELVRSMLRYSS